MRPTRFRLIDNDGGRHGTYKCADDAREVAKDIGLGDPNMADDNDKPDGWYIETTVASKISKRSNKD